MSAQILKDIRLSVKLITILCPFQLDKMSEMCGKELKKHNVTCLSLWPGLVQTEAILAAKDTIQKAVRYVNNQLCNYIIETFDFIKHLIGHLFMNVIKFYRQLLDRRLMFQKVKLWSMLEELLLDS